MFFINVCHNILSGCLHRGINVSLIDISYVILSLTILYSTQFVTWHVLPEEVVQSASQFMQTFCEEFPTVWSQ